LLHDDFLSDVLQSFILQHGVERAKQGAATQRTANARHEHKVLLYIMALRLLALAQVGS
jgi:hypothetical protein